MKPLPTNSARFAEATPIWPSLAGYATFCDASLRATGGEHSKNCAISGTGDRLRFERHQRAKMVVVINLHLKESRPWASLSGICRLSRGLGSIWRRTRFQVHAADAKGEIVVARKPTRGRLVPFFAELLPCVVAMEARSSAHHWGRVR